MTGNLYPPGPKMTFNMGVFGIIRRDPLRFFLQMSQYGPIVHTKLFGTHVYVLNDPDLIRDVLVANAKSFHKSRGLRNGRFLLGNGLLTSEDDFHQREPRLAGPAPVGLRALITLRLQGGVPMRLEPVR